MSGDEDHLRRDVLCGHQACSGSDGARMSVRITAVAVDGPLLLCTTNNPVQVAGSGAAQRNPRLYEDG